MANQLSSIEGGSILKSLFSTLFSGIDKIFDSAAEYEEEMGVLKQITKLPLKDPEGNDFSLTIKLSPIKNKNGQFYVEAETDKEGFDVSSINKKVMELNQSNMTDFGKMIDALLVKNGLIRTNDTETLKTEEQKAKEDEAKKAYETELSELAESLLSQKFEVVVIDSEGNLGGITTKLRIKRTDPENLIVNIEGYIGEKSLNNQVIQIALADGDSVKQFDEVSDEILDSIDDYADKNKLTIQRSNVKSSTQIDASFIKSSITHDVSLVAIRANSNIKGALGIVEDLTNSADFIDELSEDQSQSFSITDLGQTYDVVPIEEVDISSTYDVLFCSICELYVKLRTYNWAVGDVQWGLTSILDNVQWIVTSLLNTFAELVVRHTDHYPCIKGCNDGYMDLESLKDERGKISMEQVTSSILKDIEELIVLLDTYYVNLQHDEQAKIDDAMDQLKRILTYA